jgi:hypothetical protein
MKSALRRAEDAATMALAGPDPAEGDTAVAQTERLYKLKSIFDNRRAVSAASLRSELGVSRATLNRDLAHLRDRMNAPVVFDAGLGGEFKRDRTQGEVGTYRGDLKHVNHWNELIWNNLPQVN